MSNLRPNFGDRGVSKALRHNNSVPTLETFGHSYALTLAAWRHRLQKTWPLAMRLGFDERFKRMWQYYLAYCEAGFRAGLLDVGLCKIVHAADA